MLSSSSLVSIPLGIIAGLLASCVQSLGLTIQRKSHVQNQSLPEHRQRVEHKRPLWVLGFLIFLSSNIIGSFVQIASLPVVILAPLGAVSLLWNAFFARLLLGDVFSPWMILGTILIAGGAILIAFFGIVPEQTRSLEDLLILLRRPPFIVYFTILTFVVFVSLAVSHIVEFSLARKAKIELPLESPPLDLSPSSVTINLPSHTIQSAIRDIDQSPTSSAERSQLLDRKPVQSTASSESDWRNTTCPHQRTKLLLAISYASFSGIISGMCLIFAKSGVELLLLTWQGYNQFWRWESWILLILLGAFALLQLWYMHKALVLADPTLVCPSAFCFYNLSSIVNGLVYFDQISLIKPLHLGLVVLGIVILLGGVWVVSIQSGGGGVDVGSWNEEGIQLPGEDIALYNEPEASQDVLLPGPETPTCKATALSHPFRSRLGAVPMERETRSESSVPHEVSSLTGLGLDLGPETSSTVHCIAPTRADTQLYPTPRTPSNRIGPRRETVDGRPSLSPSLTSPGSHHRTVSHPLHSHPPHAPLSPPLGSVSTLGTGFQIGLSPVSPGFTIMPMERRRRPSGMGNAAGTVSLDGAAHEVMSHEQQIRRRTVSESEAPIRTTEAHYEEGGLAGAEAEAGAEDNHTKGGPILRWRWIRDVFLGKKDT
ncbi:hypothetical protein BJ165DRAFT_1522098 [Panaeolus papilionaceus]|nr:hypothetical protein BJ165DRAFT_1522098 [Panaeolus papilionaceus]